MDDGYISPPSLPPTSRSYLPAPFEFEFYSLLFYEYLRFVWFCRERAKSSSQSSYSPHKYKIAPLLPFSKPLALRRWLKYYIYIYKISRGLLSAAMSGRRWCLLAFGCVAPCVALSLSLREERRAAWQMADIIASSVELVGLLLTCSLLLLEKLGKKRS